MFSHHESRKQLYLWDKLQSDEEKYQTTRSVENGDATTFLKSFRRATVSEIHCLADPSLLTSFFVWAEATFYHIQTFKYILAARRLFGPIHFIIQVPF